MPVTRLAAGPTVRWVCGAALVLVLAAAPFGLAPFALGILTLGLVHGLFTYGLDLAWGRVGLVSVGHAAFFGLGAYAVGVLTRDGWSWPAAAAAGVLAATATAAGIGAVALSVPGATGVPLLILLTLGTSQLLSRAATSAAEVTGGANGIVVAGLPLVGGYYVVLGTCALVVALTVRWLVVGRRGLLALAVLTNPQRAEHLGIDLRATRLVAFTASGAVSAVAGVLFAQVSGIVTPSALGLALSTSVLTWLAVGGRASVAGSFAGAVVLTIGAQTLAGTLQSWYVLATAALFVLVVQVAPAGAAGLLRRLLGGGRDVPALPRRVRPSAPRRRHDTAGAPALLLEASDLHVTLGGTPVLRGAGLSVARGECVCLIGPNGAGKSTLLGAIAGAVPVARGRVVLHGEDVTRVPVHGRVRRGAGRMFQVPQVFAEMSVADNRRAAALLAGVEPAAGPAQGPGHERRTTAGELSMAQRRDLELDMVLTGPPDLVLLDEPAAGLSSAETVRLATRIRALAAPGRCGVVVVEHDLDLVRQLADRVVVLAAGQVIAEGSLDQVVAHDAVRAAYLGAA